MLLAITITIIISFVLTTSVIPTTITKLTERGYSVPDMYKKEKPQVPTKGGVVILFTAFLTLAMMPLIGRIMNRIPGINEGTPDLNTIDMAFLLVVAMFGFYGIVDDLIDVGRLAKVILPITFSYPLITVLSPHTLWIPILGNINMNIEIIIIGITWAELFKITIIPIYIMVVANLMNMHSGYNGLQSGLSIILLGFLIIKSIIDNRTENVLPAGAFFGAIAAFWYFNKFPAKVFEGNIGSLSFGAAIGTLIVVQDYYFFGIVILIPHITNFLLYLYWRIQNKLHPKDEKYKLVKFGQVRNNGILSVPNYYTLKWIPNYFFDLSEKRATGIIYGLTILFCIAGIILID